MEDSNKHYLVIGLGRFGSSVAKTLYDSGREVLGTDVDDDIVQESINNNYIDNAVVMDATDIRSLKGIGAETYDVAFVCIGNIEASIMITLNLKELGVKRIIAKAATKSHGKVLSKIGASKIIYPEEYMGRRIAQLVMEPNMIEHLRFSSDFLLLEIKTPSIFWNKSLKEMDIRNKYNCNIVGIKKENEEFIPNPFAETIIEKGDVLVVVTDSKSAKVLESLK